MNDPRLPAPSVPPRPRFDRPRTRYPGLGPLSLLHGAVAAVILLSPGTIELRGHPIGPGDWLSFAAAVQLLYVLFVWPIGRIAPSTSVPT